MEDICAIMSSAVQEIYVLAQKNIEMPVHLWIIERMQHVISSWWEQHTQPLMGM